MENTEGLNLLDALKRICDLDKLGNEPEGMEFLFYMAAKGCLYDAAVEIARAAIEKATVPAQEEGA